MTIKRAARFYPRSPYNNFVGAQHSYAVSARCRAISASGGAATARMHYTMTATQCKGWAHKRPSNGKLWHQQHPD